MVDDRVITNCMFSSGIRFDVQPGAKPDDGVKIHGTFGGLRLYTKALAHEISSKVSTVKDFISVSEALPTTESCQKIPGIEAKVYVHTFALKSGVTLRGYHLKKKRWDDEDELGQVLFWTTAV